MTDDLLEDGLFHVPLSKIRLDHQDYWPEQMREARVVEHMNYQREHSFPPRPVVFGPRRWLLSRQ